MTGRDQYDEAVHIPAKGRGRTTITAKQRPAILERDGYTCAYCGDMASEVNHVTPAARDGLSTTDNYVAARWPCNGQKKAMSVSEWIAWRADRGQPWPPPSRVVAYLDLVRALPRRDDGELTDEMRALDAAMRRDPQPRPLDEWHWQWLKRVHRGQLDAPEVELACFRAAIPDEVTDRGYRYGDTWTDDPAWNRATLTARPAAASGAGELTAAAS